MNPVELIMHSVVAPLMLLVLTIGLLCNIAVIKPEPIVTGLFALLVSTMELIFRLAMLLISAAVDAAIGVYKRPPKK